MATTTWNLRLGRVSPLPPFDYKNFELGAGSLHLSPSFVFLLVLLRDPSCSRVWVLGVLSVLARRLRLALLLVVLDPMLDRAFLGFDGRVALRKCQPARRQQDQQRQDSTQSGFPSMQAW